MVKKDHYDQIDNSNNQYAKTEKSSEYVTMLSPSFQPEGTIALVIRANRLPHYALILLSVCIYFTIFRSKSNQMFDIFSRKKIASSTVQSLGYYSYYV